MPSPQTGLEMISPLNGPEPSPYCHRSSRVLASKAVTFWVHANWDPNGCRVPCADPCEVPGVPREVGSRTFSEWPARGDVSPESSGLEPLAPAGATPATPGEWSGEDLWGPATPAEGEVLLPGQVPSGARAPAQDAPAPKQPVPLWDDLPPDVRSILESHGATRDAWNTRR